MVRNRELLPWVGLAVVDLLAFAIPYNPGAPVGTQIRGVHTSWPALKPGMSIDVWNRSCPFSP